MKDRVEFLRNTLGCVPLLKSETREPLIGKKKKKRKLPELFHCSQWSNSQTVRDKSWSSSISCSYWDSYGNRRSDIFENLNKVRKISIKKALHALPGLRSPWCSWIKLHCHWTLTHHHEMNIEIRPIVHFDSTEEGDLPSKFQESFENRMLYFNWFVGLE